MARRDIVGGAARSQLAADINSTATSFTLTTAVGWPTGVNGEFLIAVDRGNAGEEKLLAQSRTGLVVTLAGVGKRGADGTSAGAHTAGVYVEHVAGAMDADDSNAHIYDVTRDDHTQYLPASTAAGAGLSVTSRVLAVNVDGSSIEVNADTLRVKDGGITPPKLSFDPATQAELDAAVSTLNASIAAFEASVASTLAGAVPPTRTITAGNGLTGGGALSANLNLAVNVDGSTLEISANTVRVKDGGITAAKHGAASVTGAKLGTGTAKPIGSWRKASGGTVDAGATLMLTQKETVTGLTDGSGLLIISYPTPFSSLVKVDACMGDDNVIGWCQVSSMSTSSFTVRVLTISGGAIVNLASQTVRINYTADGY